MQTFCLTMPFWSRLWSVTQNDTIWVQLFSRDTKTILFKQSSGFLSAKSDSELHHVFGLCLTVHHWYIQYRQPTRCNNKSLLIIPIISTYFGLRFCSSSWAQDCVYSLWYNAPTMLPAGSLEAEELVYVIQVCWQLVSRSICSCLQAVIKTVWQIPVPPHPG